MTNKSEALNNYEYITYESVFCDSMSMYNVAKVLNQIFNANQYLIDLNIGLNQAKLPELVLTYQTTNSNPWQIKLQGLDTKDQLFKISTNYENNTNLLTNYVLINRNTLLNQNQLLNAIKTLIEPLAIPKQVV